MPKKAKSEKSKKEPLKNKNSASDNVDKSYQKKSDSSTANKILTQISTPQIPCDALQPWSEAFHTGFIMFYLFDALCGQHIYLYKRYWWWPAGVYSKSSAMNTDMIDTRIFVFILLAIFQYALPICLDKFTAAWRRLDGEIFSVRSMVTRSNISEYVTIFVMGSFMQIWFITLLTIICHYLSIGNYMAVILLALPIFIKTVIAIYHIIFLAQKCRKRFGPNVSMSYFDLHQEARNFFLSQEVINHFGESSDVRKTRLDIHQFLDDFGVRLACAIPSALEGAYYICYISYIFCPANLASDAAWPTVHSIMIIMNMLIFQLSHTISPIYLHSAYKITCQLGQWVKIDGVPCLVDDPEWRDGERYPKGTIVRWNNQRWKAMGKFVNAARPGQRRESSFFRVFGPSLFLYIFMICFQVTILSFQLALMHDAEYDRLIAICCEQFCGYWNLFRLVRNYITIEKCYQLSSPMCYEPEIILSRISQASQ